MVLTQVRIKSHKLLVLVTFLVLVVPLSAAFATLANAQETSAQPTIVSDKDEYPPGGTVVLTGSGWQPGESVNILVNDDEGRTWSRDVTVTADENGNIRDEFQLPDWFVATYHVTATGDSGAVAKTTFTDPKVAVRADLLQNQEWYLRYEVYNDPGCQGGIYDNKQETKIGQATSETANPDVNNASGSAKGRSVKLFASHNTVHTSSQHVHEVFDYWILDGSSTPLSDQTQNGVFTNRLAQNPNGTAHWICVDGVPSTNRTFVAVYRQTQPAALSIDDVTGAEGDSGTTNATFTVTRSGNTTTAFNVNYATANGTAQQPGDYSSRTGTLSFAANNMSKTISVPVVGDTLDEADETFFVNLSGAPAGVTISDNQGLGTILDDDETPAANDDGTPTRIAVDEDSSGGITTNVLANDTGLGDTPMAVEIQTQAGKGTATVNPDKTITYKPGLDQTGDDSYVYKITDSDGQSDTATVFLEINPVNDRPVARDLTGDDDRIATPEDTPKGITLSASDVDSTNLNFTIVDEPDHGSLTGNGANKTYTPNPNYNGPDSFTFEVCDDDSPKLCDSGTIEILVTPINDAPVIDLKPADDTTTDDEVQFTEGDPNGVLADENQNLTISDVDSTQLASASVTIANFQGGDSLLIDAQEAQARNIGVTNYDPQTGLLQLDGAASLDAYQAVLRTVRFDNSSDNPNTTGRRVEFVVTDDAGNESLVSNTAVSVVRVAAVNDPPVIESVLVTNANPVEEGSPATIKVTATDPDTPSSELRYSFDCDDDGAFEKGPQASNEAQCTYLDNGNFPVNVKVADGEGQDAGSDTDSVNVPVINVAPAATFDADPNTVNEGQNVQLSLGGVQDPGTADTHEYRFDCGSGTFGDWGNSSTSSCPTTDDGQLTVKGQVRDDDGGLSPVYEETITVNNVAPSVVLDGPDKAQEGQTKDYTYTVNDPGNDSFTVESGYPKCGANGVLEGTPVKTGTGGSFSCRFPDGDATTNVEVSVRDDDGAVDADGQRVVIVEISNVAPVLTMPQNQNATEGTSKSFALGSFTDPGTDADWSVTVDWGDNSTDTTFDTGTPGSLGQKPHRYADNGLYTVTVTVTEAGENGPPVALQEGDQNAPSDTETFQIDVANVAPTVTLSGPTPVNEGSTREYAFRIADPGDDQQSPQAVCGANGTRVNGGFQYDQGTMRGTFECKFPNVAPRGLTTKLSVTTNDGDDDGSASKNVTIKNVAPVGNDDTMTTTELKQVKANLLDNDDDPGQNLDRASMELVSIDTVGSKAAATSSDSLVTGGGKVHIDTLLNNGSVAYMPSLGFADIDAFRYKVCDTDGDCTGAKVDVEVGPIDCSDKGGAIRGTNRADVLRGTPGDDVICAFDGNDRVYGGGGTDILVGADGWDRMWSEDGNDLMRGGSGTDTLDAGLGDDLLFGDAARDIMMGRGGTDFLETKDGSSGDAGNGGAGTDTCSTDQGDKTVSCEIRE